MERDERMQGKKLLYPVVTLLLAAILIFAVTEALSGAGTKYPREGNKTKQDQKLKLDISNSSEGYFMAKVSKRTSKKLKLRVVIKNTTLDYDMPNTGEYIVVPLQMGSGKYKVSLYENTSGKKYAAAGTITLNAQLKREDGAFLYPNLYVNYNKGTKAVAQADSLCEGKSNKDAFSAVCVYMKSFGYDYVKAINIKPGMLPDIEGSWEKRMGVCQDLAAIMCCMLRTQGIPARLVIGYADKNYHAWTETTISGQDIFYDPTAALNAISKPKKYSVERFY